LREGLGSRGEDRANRTDLPVSDHINLLCKQAPCYV